MTDQSSDHFRKALDDDFFTGTNLENAGENMTIILGGLTFSLYLVVPIQQVHTCSCAILHLEYFTCTLGKIKIHSAHDEKYTIGLNDLGSRDMAKLGLG